MIGRPYNTKRHARPMKPEAVESNFGAEFIPAFLDISGGNSSDDEQEDPKEVPVLIKEIDEGGGRPYTNQPSLHAQYEKYPESCRVSAPKYIAFQIPDQVEECNLFLERAEPVSHPEILLLGEPDKQWIPENKNWCLLIRYKEVMYKQLAS